MIQFSHCCWSLLHDLKRTWVILRRKKHAFLLSQCYLFLGLFFSFGVILCLVFFNLMINGYTFLIEIFLFSSFTYYYFFAWRYFFPYNNIWHTFFTDTVNSVISGHHRGNDFCPLVGDVRLLKSLTSLTFCCLGRGSLKVPS